MFWNLKIYQNYFALHQIISRKKLVQYVAQYPDTSVSDCNNFPLLIARALKFGPEEIYLVLNMTKDSLTFLPLFLSRN